MSGSKLSLKNFQALMARVKDVKLLPYSNHTAMFIAFAWRCVTRASVVDQLS